MTLSTGARLGPYEIVASIGAGGMGEVYKARDTRLERFVAVKVLPDSLAGDPERRERFEREARTISSLNHPHICALYDVGREGTTEYLVMELLEGETLADRLTHGPLPIDQALKHAIDIADALSKAHRQGIIHRDLKPGNIMLTKQGAKLLDFGLARVGAAAAPSSGSFLPTQQRPLTQQGTLLGTFQYMSPEQLEGQDVDARADIFAFGAVLYEMVTGRRAFDGKTQASLVASIMAATPPPISSVQPMTPPSLERVVRVCLAKDPEERWQTAQDLGAELKWILEGGSQVGSPAPVVAKRRSRERWAWTAVAVLGVIAAGVTARLWMAPAPIAPDPTRFSVLAPKEITIEWPRLSPDGKTLAFVGRDSQGVRFIWVRPMGAFEATRLEGTQGVARPFWSPDSKYLAFFVGTTQLKKIAAVGGPPQLICETDFGSDGSWSSQGVILFDGRVIDPIRRVADSGGVPTVAVKPDAGLKEVGSAWPYFLPDGRHFLFMSTDTSAPLALKVGTLDDEKTTVLADIKSRVEFAFGHLFYVTENTLMARPFDAATRAFAGDPFPVTDRMQVLGATGLVDFSTSMSGDLAYIGDVQAPLSQLVWLDRQGKETPAVAAPAAYRDMALSPDDSKLAVSISTRGLAQIWVVDLKRGTSSPLTFAGNRIYPLWSRDGQRILYHWDRAAGDHGVGQKLASGAGDEKMLRTDKVEMSPNDISPDDKTILVQSISADELKVVTLPADGTGPFADLLAAPKPIAVTRSRFSPDGKWIAYQSTESGRSEIFVQSYPPTGGKWQISTDGGNTPFWRGDGKEIFVAKTDDSIWSVPIRVSGPNIEPGVPVRLFQRRMVHGARERNVWVVSRDGQRFLLNVPPAETVQGSIQVVLNWAGGLARK